MKVPVALEELFVHLVREGFPLSVRDLHEALRALEAGFGAGNRQNLMRLCQHLWARTEDEHRRINLLFQQALPLPTAKEIATLVGQPAVEPEPPTDEWSGPQRRLDGAGGPNDPKALEILGPDQAGGVGLPRASVASSTGESFILTPKPHVPLRACVIAWRRYRRTQRSGPRLELDLEQTIAAKARHGVLPEPVFVPRRRNQARIILLVDSSAAMAAWAHSTATLVESLREGRLGASGVFYFDEVPDRLFERPGLTSPVPIARQFDQFRESPAIVVSDGGSARGGVDHLRIEKTRDCLNHIAMAWRPITWLNPMAPSRWRSTSASAIAKTPGLSMLPFTPDGLIQAIDLMRGQRQP